MLINSCEVPVTIRKREDDGTIFSEETRGWTTNCPHLVITPIGRFHVLTHAPSGACVVNQSASMPDLYRLADLLAKFDWSSPTLYESHPDDWDQRTEVVRAWYLDVFHDVADDQSPFGGAA